MANNLTTLANARVVTLLVFAGLVACIAAFVAGMATGAKGKEAEILEAKQQYAQQAYKICFVKEREIESMNSQRARRSCEWLKEI